MTEQEKYVEINTRLKVADVWRYNMHIAYKSWFSKIVLVLGLALLGWTVFKFINRGTMTWDIFVSQNIIFIMLSVFILIATPWKVWNITASQMQSPIFANGAKYIFYTDKIYIKAGQLEDTVPWETYCQIIETSKDFRLFVDKVQAQIIPKHNMTQEQIATFKELVKQANPENIYKLK